MPASRVPVLVAIILLPLAIIGVQIGCGARGPLANSCYKLAFILPPLAYCRLAGINVPRDIFKWHNWRRGWRLAWSLGVLAAGIFLVAYALFGDVLLDKPAITDKIYQQFGVNAGTVFLIAPITILINSLVEEFFYRGFAYGLLSARNRWLGTWLPPAVFTAQHLLFIYHWVAPLPFMLAIVSLFVFSLVLQAVYSKADSIVAPWIIHVCGDLAMMLIAMELVF